MPAITILTPVRNGLPYVRETIDSVLAQDFTDWELIVSDNGSTDGTLDYLATLDDPRIRVHRQEVNLGIFGNLNFLFRQASAPIVFILCADDWLLPGGLKKTLLEWETARDDVAYIRFNYTKACRTTSLMRRFAFGLIPPERSDLLFFAFGNLSGNLSNVSVRVDRVRELNFFREDLPYSGDIEMWARLGRNWPFLITDTEVSFVRQHEGQASVYLNRKGELVDQLFKVVAQLFAELESRHPKWLLKLHATLIYNLQHRDTGVRALVIQQNIGYLREVNKVSGKYAIFLNSFGCWALYLLTGGGRWGREFAAQKLLAKSERNQ